MRAVFFFFFFIIYEKMLLIPAIAITIMAKLASKKGTSRFHARRKGRHKKKTNLKLMSYIYTRNA
jgi:hypothetical protein